MQGCFAGFSNANHNQNPYQIKPHTPADIIQLRQYACNQEHVRGPLTVEVERRGPAEPSAQVTRKRHSYHHRGVRPAKRQRGQARSLQRWSPVLPNTVTRRIRDTLQRTKVFLSIITTSSTTNTLVNA